MNTIRQMLRQPLKTISGLLLITAAVAAMVVTVAQSVSLKKTEKSLSGSFSTVALLTDRFQTTAVNFNTWRAARQETYYATLPEEISAWLSDTIEENPQLFVKDARQCLASAFFSELCPINYTCQEKWDGLSSFWRGAKPAPEAMPYTCAALEITLTQITENDKMSKALNPRYNSRNGTEYNTELPILTLTLSGTIERVITLEEGYSDPTGFTLTLYLEVADREELEALDLTVGERYLVYGMDYFDLDWQLRACIAFLYGVEMPSVLKQECLILYTEEEVKKAKARAFFTPTPNIYSVARYVSDDLKCPINNRELEEFRHVSLTASNRATLPQYEWIDDADGGAHLELTTGYSYIDADGNEIAVTKEEYCERYSVPTIVHLDGSVEDFLASDEAALWNEAIRNAEVNNHAFPIIGVDNLMYVGEFAKENARICDGRMFTDEELQSGAKVCILSDTLAEANGIKVGDTISPQFYNYDRSSPYQSLLEDGHNLVNPGAYFYTSTTPFCGEAEEFTVIGLYHKNNSWESVAENSCAFTPNAIFVPNNAIPSTTDTADLAFFRTLVLQHGAIGEFSALASQAGYGKLFTYHDQGYSEIAEVFLDYSAVAKQAVAIGIAVYAVILVLFLFLFPAGQGKTLAIMNSLGATKWEKMRHILVTSLGILLPGTVAGVGVGMLLWGRVCDLIMQTAGVEWTMDMDIGTMAAVAGVQLAATLVPVTLLAFISAAKKNGMKRK